MSSRSAWVSEQVPDQSGLKSGTPVSKKKKGEIHPEDLNLSSWGGLSALGEDSVFI